ncbi:hypothetical protein [Brevundimonas sp.]|uniref:hypothetical protein n=1 Tax=Brevundimonas sp. TaxID=1871086 RepID=UPI0025C2D929|nr:hypothetical protein [Brevundimonas sp.]
MRNGLALANPQDDEDDPALLRQRMAAEAYNTRPSRRRPSYNSELTIPPGRTRTDNSAQRAAEREARRTERVEQEIFRARQRLLQVSEDDLLTAQQRLNGRIDQGERNAVIRNNLSPLQAWRDESLKTADEIREAYENVGARGLDALNSGIVDAIMNTKSLGETFSSVAKQILADLLSISVRRGITEPLADMLFGGSGSGSGGGIGSSIFSAIKSAIRIPGFSSGVTNFGGGLAYVHAGEILANLPAGTDVIPAHAVPVGWWSDDCGVPVARPHLSHPDFRQLVPARGDLPDRRLPDGAGGDHDISRPPGQGRAYVAPSPAGGARVGGLRLDRPGLRSA